MKYFFISAIAIAFIACSAANGSKPNKNSIQRKLSDETKAYWYNGEGAEITSYQLSQARYGELREGEAVMVFVTEPFSPSSNTKADRPRKDNQNVLKLNFTKRFDTGIYPYSMMNSSFYPVENGNSSLKISTSVQEWCGHVYMEMRNKDQFELDNFSYFEGESFHSKIDKVALEDDIWSQIRLHPETIASGKTKMVPSFFYLRLTHKETKAYACEIETYFDKGPTRKLKISYPELDRTLTIEYTNSAPYSIESWTESYIDGWGPDKKRLETTGKKIKSIRSKYWEKNNNSDAYLREELGLKL
jgi:hypothetical protein